MSVVALVIAPSIALNQDAMVEKAENKEHKIPVEVKEDDKLVDNIIYFENSVKK
jgi:hypothetical protein